MARKRSKTRKRMIIVVTVIAAIIVILAVILLMRRTNPLVADTDVDTDGDGLNDNLEINIYKTNPSISDSDVDGLNDGAEVNTYHTDPLATDTDNDGLNDGLEVNTYMTNPLVADTDGDKLSDGIEVKGYDVNNDNIIEVDFPAFGANPLVKDIFVEVDWMPGTLRKLGNYAKGKLAEAFAEHDMVLHIDQGELGGGSETEELASNLHDNIDGPMNDFYDYENKYFTAERRGVFYWCLLASGDVYNWENVARGGLNFGATFVLGGRWPTEPMLGSVFMHELGHGLGLNPWDFDGIDSTKYSFDSFDQYRSVMNYNAPFSVYELSGGAASGSEFFNYSEGGLFNDWEHINFEWLEGRNYST